MLLVLISHWLFGLPYVENLRLGSIGVDFFFVISGFLISLQLFNFKNAVENKQETFGRALFVFYARRILRIFPLYYLIVIISAIFNSGEIREALLWNLAYASNFYFIKLQYWPGIFSHFWSLSVEEHFYLVWPFIVLFINKKYFPHVFTFVILFSVLFRYAVFNGNPNYFVLNVHTFSCLDLFMLGGFVAFLFEYKKELFLKMFTNVNYRFATFFSFALLYFIWIIKSDWGSFNWIYQRFLFGVIYASLIGFLASGRGFGKLFENKFLSHLGKLSYAIYLIHNFVPGILLPIKEFNLPFYIEFIIYLFVTLVISEILYRLVEKPIRNLNKNFKLKTELGNPESKINS